MDTIFWRVYGGTIIMFSLSFIYIYGTIRMLRYILNKPGENLGLITLIFLIIRGRR